MDRNFTTTDGRTFELIPVSQTQLQKVALAVEAEYRKRGDPLDPPTYVTAIGETATWTAEGVAKDGTEADKAAWALHADARARCVNEQNLRALKVQVLGGFRA